MPFSAGDKLGPYEILVKIGTGGMGEVYRAHDPRLRRDVAIKVSAERFSERFEREAHAVAALNHPNICAIYDVGSNYLVMEYVEGEAPKGPLPLEEALRIARQIGDALEEAHGKGIVHRDLKPANIKIKPDGTVKVLDFGLAKQTGPVREGGGENSPTISMAATQAGMILGTAGYMSPEQARGKAVDKRADIWAFGVVLHELLTGRRVFAGEDVTSTLAKVIEAEPKWDGVPPRVQRLLKKCLEKDPKDRLRDIGDAWELLESGAEAPRGLKPAPQWAAIGALVVALGVALWAPWRSEKAVDKPLVRLDVDLGADVALPPPDPNGPAVVPSPDGTRIAYVASVSGGPVRLFTRRLDQVKATELPGTQGAFSPFFSPDGQWIGFYANNKLNKISVEGGAVVPIVENVGPNGAATWAEDGNIYTALGAGGVSRFPAAGGTPEKLTELESGKEFVHVFSQVLPGGKAILYTAYDNFSADGASVQVVSLADHRKKVLVPGGTYARYLPTGDERGHLVYGNKGTVFAVPFDLARLEIQGTPLPVLDGVTSDLQGGGSGHPQIDFAQNGTVVYRAGGSNAGLGLMTIQWLDSAGKTQPLLAKPATYSQIAGISPDGKRILYSYGLQAVGADLWVYDWQRDVSTKLTFGGGPYLSATWSPDSRYLIAGTLKDGMYAIQADGASQPQQLMKKKAAQIPTSITADGKRLAFNEIDLAGGASSMIWIATLSEEGGQLKIGKAEQFLKSKSPDLYNPQFSPDGRWIAYQSSESGTNEIYVRPASGESGKWTISTNGGQFPIWSPTDHELLYQQGDQAMAVSYSVNGNAFIPGKSRVWAPKLGGARGFTISPDGKRLAIVTPVATLEAPKQEHEVVFLFNFFDELRRRVPLTK